MLPDWFNKDNVTIVSFLFSAVIGPLIVIYLGRYFARKEAVDAVHNALNEHTKAHAAYVEQHAEEHDEIEGRLNRGETRFITLEAAIREVKTAAEDAQQAAEKAQAAADRVNHALLEVEKVRGDFKELRAIVGPLKDLVAAAMIQIGGKS